MRPLLLNCLLALAVAITVGCGDDDDNAGSAKSPGRAEIRVEFAMVGIPGDPFYNVMYHVDTPRGRVDAFDFDPATGALGRRRAVIDVAPEHGRPDGLAVDAEGGIWVGLWGGAAVHRYAPNGRLDERVELPVSQVTSCCFGDEDLATLYVTSAARGTRGEPLAGSLFACRPGIRGLGATPFAG